MMYIRYMLLVFSNITILFVCGIPTPPCTGEDRASISDGLSASSTEESNPCGSSHETSNSLTLLRAAGQASPHLQNSPPPDRRQATTDTAPYEEMQSRLATRSGPVSNGQHGSISPATDPSTPISGVGSLIQGNCGGGGLSAGANVSDPLPSTINVPGTAIHINVYPIRSQAALSPWAVIYCFIELDSELSIYLGTSFLDHNIAENIMGDLGATVNLFPYLKEPEKITYFEMRKVVRAFLDVLNPDVPICPATFVIQRGEQGNAFAGGRIKKGDVDSGGTTLGSNSSVVAVTRRKRAAR